MLAAEMPRPGLRGGLLTLIAALVVGSAVATVGLTQQLGLTMLAMATIVAVVATRAGLVLDPAWFIVLALFSVSTIDEIVDRVGLQIQLVAIIAAAPIPFVLGALATRDRAPIRLWPLVPLVLLFAYAVLSLVWSRDSGYGLEKLQLWILTGLLPVIWMIVLVTRKGSVSWRVVGLAGLLYAVSLLVFGIQTQLYPGRQVLFDENPIWAARALFVGALAIGFGPFRWWFRLAAVPLIIAAGVTTDSTGPLLGLAFGIWAGATVWIHRAGWAKPGVLLLGGVIGLGLAAVAFSVVAADVDNGGRVLEEFARDPNITSRAYYYDVAMRIFAANPLGGVGIGGYAALGPGLYPHNMLLEIAAEFGLVGIGLFGAWLVLAIRGTVTSPVLAALLAASLAYTLFSGSIASNAEFWIVSAIGVARAALPVESVRRTSNASGG